MKNQNPSYRRQESRFRHFQLESPLELEWGPFWAQFWEPFGPQMAPTWPPEVSRRSKTTLGASKIPLRRLQDRPSTSQNASRTAPSAPKTPPRLSKSLQDGSVSLQDVSKSSPEEVFETPSCLQELSGGAFQASSLETLCCKQGVFGNGLGSAGIATRIQFRRKFPRNSNGIF